MRLDLIRNFNSHRSTWRTQQLPSFTSPSCPFIFGRFDYAKEYPKAEADIANWIKEGKIKRKFHVEQGLEKCPEYLQLLYNGGNSGKLWVPFVFLRFVFPLPDRISAY